MRDINNSPAAAKPDVMGLAKALDGATALARHAGSSSAHSPTFVLPLQCHAHVNYVDCICQLRVMDVVAIR